VLVQTWLRLQLFARLGHARARGARARVNFLFVLKINFYFKNLTPYANRYALGLSRLEHDTGIRMILPYLIISPPKYCFLIAFSTTKGWKA
jgi:hypothetical protein